MKFLRILLILFVVLVALFGAAVGTFFVMTPRVGAAPDLKVESSPEKIERGRYLAQHVASCIDCHSVRDFQYLGGPLKPGTDGHGGTRFGRGEGVPGEVWSPNLTPTGIGDWTDGEVLRAMTEGVSRDGRALFPIMPYRSYGRMSREDAEAVIAYLRTLPAGGGKVPTSALSFPMNLIVRLIPAKADPQPRPDGKDTVALGKYLVNAAACADCHTPRDHGEPVPGMELAGGNEFPLPDGSVSISANITPGGGSAAATRTREQFIALFRDYPAQKPVEPGAFNTIMPWTRYSGMSEEDLGAIYDYLKTVPAVDRKVSTFRSASATVEP